MTAPTASVPAMRETPRGLRRFAWAVLAYNIAVILWGAIVRATSSGNGCGEHWPLCNGTLLQHAPRLATLIELAHRSTSGIALIAMIALAAWTFRGTAKRHLARTMVGAAAFFTLNEAFLGALLVLLGKTGRDQSPSRGVYLSLHLANTLLLLASLALAAHFLSRRAGRMRDSVELHGMGLAGAGLAATILTGVSGSLAALADTLYPVRTLGEGFRQDMAAHSVWLLRVRWVHPVASVAAGVFVAWLLVSAARRSAQRRFAAGVAALLAVQFALGMLDLLLLAPTWMQVLHLLGADVLWSSLVVLSARLCVVPVGWAEAESA